MNPPVKTLIGLAHRLGVSPLMRRMRRQTRAQGARLRFGPRAVTWRRGDLDVLLRPDSPHTLEYRLGSLDYVLSKAIPEQVGRRRVLDLRGAARYRLPSGRIVWLPTPIEKADTCAGYLARGAPGPGDVVLDAGAFCGELTVELALRVGPAGHVYAFEPNPLALGLLERNLALHGLTNVTLVPHALWETTTTLKFASTADPGATLSLLASRHPKEGRQIEVSALSPAEAFARIGRVPDFIKMDIEGAEVEVLAAMAPLLRAHDRPVRLAVASYHIRDGRLAHELITPGLQAAGLTVETGYPSHTTTWAWKP